LIDAGLDCNSLKEICVGIENKDNYLEYLDLKHNIFDDEGVGALIKSLKESASVKHIYLESTRIS
jgi:hypothetical protein